MGHVYVDSIIQAKDGDTTVKMFVDIGPTFSMLAQALVAELAMMQLPGWKQTLEFADGSVKEYPVAIGNIEVAGRKSTGERFLIAEVSEPVLGVLALEALGLTVDPTTREVRESRSWQARGPWEARAIA